jgi:hypothetical protein
MIVQAHIRNAQGRRRSEEPKMPESPNPVELVLEDAAKDAVAQIASLLGEKATEEEAVERALGTELYLLEQVVKEGGRVFVHAKNGDQLEVKLVG